MAFLGTGILSGNQSFGSRIGGDIADILGGLAHGKSQAMHQQKQSMELQRVGFPKPLADIFPSLDPKTQQDIWKQINLQAIGQAPEQSQMTQAPVQPTIPQPTFTPDQTQTLKGLTNPQERNQLARQFQQANQEAQQQATPISSQPSARFGQAAAQQQAIEAAKPKSIFNAPHDQLGEQKQLADYKQVRKEEFENAKYEREKVDRDIKESKEWFKETNKKARGLKETNARLNRMEQLIDTGKLTNPIFASALDTLSQGVFGFGINLKSLQNAESQEFEKLSNDMLKGIQDVFGSRILKTEVDNFLKTIPTLSQTDSGKKAVIDNLKLLNQASIAQDTIAKEIIKENNGHIPPNLEVMVDEQLDPYLDDLHKKFVNQTHEKAKYKRNDYPVLGAVKDVFWT